MAIETPVPAGLRKLGIERVTDNVGADQRLAVPGSLIWMFFEAELKARFVRQDDAATEIGAGLPK